LPATPEAADESRVLEALRDGDEAAFVELVDRHTGSMLRVARMYVGSQAVAEEIVQETWLSVLRSLDRFEGRSSLRTWIFVILGNCARKHAEREGRSIPLTDVDAPNTEPSVAPERFFPSTHPRWAGMWSTLVDSWDRIPDDELIAGEGRQMVEAVLAELPTRYATVFILRDIDGWASGDVCALLGITLANQRVLLHRARTRIRAALEEYFGQETR
jgi:RNA polymerase sigma-70 factor (ECF subfamily)